ncbi:MAG: cation:proton antiporter [Aestuariivirga sp.]|uniref:cation:proton antiporter domain-containing protein n=1 Tax=Aestuariivirga sp. TaxID=2650926 RepID=UPI0025BA30AB|nr:cation:proton antiporter [Aestuariivirga sp.]MCA3561998.1 cation:proton antiporter [Aestuariivirga sp.]
MPSETAFYYKEFLIVLGVAGLAVPLFLRIGVNAVLAFLVMGVLLSPDILGRLAHYAPALSALSIAEPRSLGHIAELGVVFLLFLIGIELSFERLNTMRRLVFGLGGLQVALSLAAVAAAALLMGFDIKAALVAGAALSLSSTAIVVQLLSDAKRLGSQTGRTSFAILLMQDLAVIPFLLLLPILGQRSEGSVAVSVLLALLQAAAAIAVIIIVGRFLLRPLLRLVARTGSPDLFMAATLLIAVGAAAAASLAGISMTLGAFIAGLMLAETEYRRAIEAVIEPFKGLLLGTFFLVVGLKLDLDALFANPLYTLGLAAGLILIKGLIVYGLARLFRVNRGASLESALLLGPCGEFGFVIAGTALAYGLIDDPTSRNIMLLVTITMIAIPALAKFGQWFTRSLRQRAAAAALQTALPEANEPRVIIAGFGRVGRLVASMLEEHKIPYLAVDADADLVTRENKAGSKVYYGDAANPEFLKRCGLAEARALAITMDNQMRVDEVARVARTLRGGLKIIARARDERHAQRLYAAGVTEAVPETIESSLQLGEALLVETGVPMGLAIASVHERRDGFRKLLGRPNRKEELELAKKRLRREKSAG